MQFVVTAHDYPDALDRRIAVRERHLAVIERLVRLGHVYCAAALLDGERMIGSVFICDFDDRAALDAWLESDPYSTAHVWERIDVHPGRIGPFFKPVKLD